MLICGECSARNDDGESFCSNCGAYLDWQQESGPAQEGRPVLTTTAGSGTGPGPAVTTEQIPVIPVPGEPEVLRDEEPAEVKPGQRVLRAPRPTPPRDEPGPLPGDVICATCGTGNKAERHFCRRCAAVLKETPAAPLPALPWWRRFFGRQSRRPLPAGTRPKLKKPWRFPVRTVSVLAVLGLYGGAAYLGRDVITAGVVRAQDETSGLSEVRADKIEATSETDGRIPELAIDTFANRSWASAAGRDVGAELRAAFDRPFRLSYVVISPGAWKDDYRKEQRPVQVEITAVRADGGQSARRVRLQDNASPQSFYIGADEVSAVRLKILESTGPEGAPVSVAEIQFAGRR